MMRGILLSTVAIVSVAMHGAAIAQDQSAGAQTGPAQSGIIDIIVTAERRLSSVQTTPIAISAVGGEALREKNITNIESLSSNIPNLNFNRVSSDAKISIRGIGYNAISPGGEPRVALYQDGIYLARNQAALLGFYDIDRVEVLRGPQGTLYGRNAIAGTINVLSRDPGDSLNGYFTGSVGNYGLIGTEGAVGGPLSPTVQARISFRTVDRNGYGRNITTGADVNDENSRSVRARLKFDPGSTLTVRLTGDYSISRENDGGYRYAGRGNSAIPTSVELLGAEVPDDPQDAAGFGPRRRIETYGFSGQADLDLSDSTTMTLLTAYRHFTASQRTNIDGSAAELSQMYIDEASNVFSTELRLAQKIGDFADIIIGAYYFHERNSATNQVPFKGSVFGAAFHVDGLVDPDALYEFYGSYGRVKTNAKAVFAQANIRLTQKLELDVGARYSDEKKVIFEQHQVDVLSPFILDNALRPGFDPANGLFGNGAGSQSASWDSFDPKVTLSYKAGSGIYLYATYSRGFKAGGYNVGGIQPAFRPEKLTNYEAGIKADLFDRRLRINLSAFNYDYKDLQESIIDGINIVTKNATKARVRGIEAEITAKPTDALTLQLNAAYLDGKFKEFRDIDPAFADLGSQNLKGNQLPDAPKYQVGGEVGYRIGTGFGDITPRVNVTWFDRVYFNHFNTVEMSQPSRTMVNFYLGWTSPGAAWSATAFIKNVTDDTYFAGANTNLGLLGFSRTVAYGAPRTFGLSVTRTF
ncbi:MULTISPECIES: TonB-dependent receptor [Sphingobium]|uniref:TonB-dependent receptor n=1 Tax=Sphingobium chungbukense TaxID=56193 RepID=A0A0M3ANQ1_9SPHN|nr:MULTISPECIES: TonB-dependent receptor [Sphingobium]KKW91568.1 hypothetical protein YP76_14390 [Sphingobium chungbukense]PJG46474.1 hypothetical protein CAF53_20105 [Sphingobium sp. LB126]